MSTVYGGGLLLIMPLFFIVLLWRIELKKKKQQQRIKKALNIAPVAALEKKPPVVVHVFALPDAVVVASLLVLPMILFFLGFPWFFIIGIDVGLYFCLKAISTMLLTRYLNKLTEALPSSIDFLSRSITSGNSIIVAIEQIAHANLPASDEFKPIFEALSVGKPFAETLKKRALKVSHPDFSLCMAVLIIQHETGTHDVRALNSLTALLRSKIALRNKIKSSSAEAKLSGYLIAILPSLSLLVLWLFSSDYIAPIFNTTLGQYLFITAVCSNIIGLIIMKKMTQISM